ncbi:hypothetical protein JOD97_003174 [Duganella sp. 1411]|uniref:glycine-rich domain-containing protein n=1 Tax=Duganella sp. 1411 TaxID=2806572 RepID=UPI001AE2BC11|nr:hypothetical protein [Duganella sp. 1411]MBP1205132.1 hypothetical protein [Duganella sp. 1411]
MSVAVSIACISLATFSGVLWQRQRRAKREAYIRDFLLPKGLFEALRVHHPQLTLKDCQLVSQGLRQFFLAHLKSGGKFVSMPSQVADDLWHEFILYTRAYEQFCRRAFGRTLHHTPAVVLSKRNQGNAGIRRTWYFACHEENINPHKPSRLPLLFALDSKLDIPNGFNYVPDCSGFKRKDDTGYAAGGVYCGADLGGGDGGGDGGSADGGGDGGADGGGDGGCGGGCGGGGCGGGGD